MNYTINEFKARFLTDKAPDGCALAVGDLVELENYAGVRCEHRVIGFDPTAYDARFVHLDTVSFWFAVTPERLTVIEERG